MRAFVALALVAAGIAVAALLLARAALRPRAGVAHAAAQPPPAARPARAPALQTAAPDPPAPPAQPRSPRPAGEELAHLHGRLLPPEGRNEIPGTPIVTADDGADSYDALLEEEGEFSLHLPPGAYALAARTDELIGRAENVRLRAGERREVVIRMQEAAKVTGVVRTATGPASEVEVSASLPGSPREEVSDTTGSDGSFSLAALRPGVRYQLSFEGRGVHEVPPRTVVAPAADLDILLEGRPVLRGAIGFEPAEACPFRNVMIRDQADGHTHVFSVDARCRFEADGLAEGATLLVRALGDGWYAQARVKVPEHGDPEPLCLNPPCREPRVASLTVLLPEGGAEGTTGVSVSVGDKSWGCATTGTRCELHDLPVGQELEVFPRGVSCTSERMAVTLHAGANTVTVPCPRMRTVSAVVRWSGGAGGPGPFAVRCPGARERTISNALVFSLRCRAEARELEYTADPTRPWRRLPLPAPRELALVELPLP
jgi:hypothetical protein